MDELEISGRRYISSRRAAKEHKYHSDYIGQLVRGGKVAGQKVGRAWYVDADSLAEYLGKEVPPRGPMKVAQIPEPVKQVEEAEEVTDEPEEAPVVEYKKTPVQLEDEPEFALPFRKSGRAHTIAAINTQQKTKQVEQRKITEPIIEERIEVASYEIESNEVSSFEPQSYADEAPQEETFIPLKIERESVKNIYQEPVDSFYKVSQRGLKYVSQSSAQAQKPQGKEYPYHAQDTVVSDKNLIIPRTLPSTQRAVRKGGGKTNILRAVGVVLIAGIASLAIGIFASYYLHSVTTIEGNGQSSGLLLAK